MLTKLLWVFILLINFTEYTFNVHSCSFVVCSNSESEWACISHLLKIFIFASWSVVDRATARRPRRLGTFPSWRWPVLRWAIRLLNFLFPRLIQGLRLSKRSLRMAAYACKAIIKISQSNYCYLVMLLLEMNSYSSYFAASSLFKICLFPCNSLRYLFQWFQYGNHSTNCIAFLLNELKYAYLVFSHGGRQHTSGSWEPAHRHVSKHGDHGQGTAADRIADDYW